MATPVAGARLGPYELVAPAGAGGMGEVWKARDTRVDRVVAIKFSQPDFLKRFDAEARSIAALNHPNICHLYDVGPDYLVMEYVDGAPVSVAADVRKLLDLAVQIADALATAHSAGVVHRDLKPDNILVTRDGRVKVLDFGLAKQAGAAAASSETATRTIAAVTNPGTVLGTAAYMSPEQARGQPVDFRSDQFSFGLVLYELATGKRAFQRDSTAETMAAIIREDPDPPQKAIPAPLRWTIERCLSKDPAGRYDSTRDLYHELRTIREHLSEATASSAVATAPAPARSRTAIWVAAAALMAVVIAIGAAAFWPRERSPQLTYTPLAVEPLRHGQPTWGPDGRTIAYVAAVDGVNQLFTRSLDAAVAAQLTHGGSVSAPFWSVDGTHVFFNIGDATIYSVGASGGPVTKFLDDARTGSFSPDGRRFVFYRPSDRCAYVANADGSQPVRIEGLPPGTRNASGSFSADGKKIALVTTGGYGKEIRRELWLLDGPGRNASRVNTPASLELAAGTRPAWLRDNRRVLLAGDDRPITASRSHIYRVDVKSGAAETVTASTLQEMDPAISPDGRRVAMTILDARADILQFSLETGKSTALVETTRENFSPKWMPSGREFVFVSNASGATDLRIAGEGGALRAVALGGATLDPISGVTVSSDGQRLAFDTWGLMHRVMLASVVGGTPVVLDPTTNDSHVGSFSPDGAWIVYSRFIAGESRITKIPSGGGDPIDLTKVPMRSPGFPMKWSPRGDWIVYSGGGLHAISPDGKNARTVMDFMPTPQSWDFAPDGSKLYVLRGSEEHGYEVLAIDMTTLAQRKVAELQVPARTILAGMSLHADGKRFLTAARRTSSSIWLVDGLTGK